MSKAMPNPAESVMRRFLKSVWAFPTAGVVVVILLTLFQISGSSMGVYHTFFYGDSKDPALLLNRPRPIRSDEWLTNTQLTIAQQRAGYPRINHNIGNGEDMAIIQDVPYKDWSTVFRPQNWAFFVLPLGYAFALKWWLMGWLLVISCYFFVLLLLPGRRLFAALFALALFFSPFVQWWYEFTTLGSIYYGFLLALAFAYLLKAKRRSHAWLLGGSIAYLMVSFALILYPPFQIACAMVIAAFALGYLIEQRTALKRRDLIDKLGILAAAAVVAGLLTGLFLHANAAAVTATRNSSYPGHRVVLNGGFDDVRLLTSFLAFQFQFSGKAAAYYFPVAGIANQSETSNFLYIMPFLILPGLLLLVRQYRRDKRIDWPLLLSGVLFAVFMLRLFWAHLDPLFKLLLFDPIPHQRLLIGTGLLGVIYIALLARNLAVSKLKPLPYQRLGWLGYALIVYAVEVWLGLIIRHRAPGFIDASRLLLFALPFPVIIYLLLDKRFGLAAAGLLAFSVFCSIGVNPLYHGTRILTDSALDHSIQTLSKAEPGRWIAEGTYLENYAILNGAPSLSGTYTYPQLKLWRAIPGVDVADYNRFAHADFALNHGTTAQPTSLVLRGGDNFVVQTDACSDYLHRMDVRFVLTSEPLDAHDGCATLVRTFVYPTQSLFIYHLRD